MGSYELSEAENVQRGTKIVIHLKGECYDYSKEDVIKGIFVFVQWVFLIYRLCFHRWGRDGGRVGRINRADGTGEARAEIVEE